MENHDDLGTGGSLSPAQQRHAVYRMVHAGNIPAFKAGNQRRFRKDDVDAWLEKNRRRTRTS